MPSKCQSLTLLLAISPGREELVRPVLADDYSLIIALHLDEAIELAKKYRPAAILCDMTFADCRMFDFLRACKGASETASIPFVCCQLAPSGLPRQLLDNVEIACRVLGCEFLKDPLNSGLTTILTQRLAS